MVAHFNHEDNVMIVKAARIAQIEATLFRIQQELQEYISESEVHDLSTARTAQSKAENCIYEARRQLTVLKNTLVN